MVTKEKHIEELVLDAKKAAEEQVNTAGMPGSVVNLQSAGFVYIWDSLTGEHSIVNKNMLRNLLTRTRADGSRVFTTVQPPITPYRGKELCLLHGQHPDRPKWDKLGLSYCKPSDPQGGKSNLRTPQDVKLHMQHRHKNDWNTIEAENRRQIEEEERQLRHLNLKILGGQFTPTAPAPAPVAQEAPVVKAPKVVQAEVSGQCPKCSETLTGKGEFGLKTAMRWHDKRKHA